MQIFGSRGENNTFAGVRTEDVEQKETIDFQNSNKESADLSNKSSINGFNVTTNFPLSLLLSTRDLNSYTFAAPSTLPRKVSIKKLTNPEYLHHQVAEDLDAASAEINENVGPDASHNASPGRNGAADVGSSFHWVVDEDDHGIIVLNAHFADSDHEKPVNGQVYFTKRAFVERHRTKCGQPENTAAPENFKQAPLELFRADAPAFWDAPEMENAVDTDSTWSDLDSLEDPFIDIEADQQFLELNSPDRNCSMPPLISGLGRIQEGLGFQFDVVADSPDARDECIASYGTMPDDDIESETSSFVIISKSDLDDLCDVVSRGENTTEDHDDSVASGEDSTPDADARSENLVKTPELTDFDAQELFVQTDQAVTKPCSHITHELKADSVSISNSHDRKIRLSPNHEHENNNRERKDPMFREDRNQENQSVLPWSGGAFGELPWWEDSWHKGPQDGCYFKEASRLRYRPSSELRSRLPLEVMPEVNDSICQSSKL